jgi:hypothetical protein
MKPAMNNRIRPMRTVPALRVLTLAATLAGAAFAQSNGPIVGMVKGSDGSSIPEARVQV